jgi:hypothetical protein
MGVPSWLLLLVLPGTCHLRAKRAPASPPPSPGPEGADWISPRIRSAREEVWTDALPQRNCGRFSRRFPLPKKVQRTANKRAHWGGGWRECNAFLAPGSHHAENQIKTCDMKFLPIKYLHIII